MPSASTGTSYGYVFRSNIAGGSDGDPYPEAQLIASGSDQTFRVTRHCNILNSGVAKQEVPIPSGAAEFLTSNGSTGDLIVAVESKVTSGAAAGTSYANGLRTTVVGST